MDGGVLWPVTRALIALIGVCALAWVSLTWLSRRGFATPGSGGGRLKLIERMSLGQRRQLYLVQADSRLFLLAAAESGPLSLIAELNAAKPASHDGDSA
jgi:flagellar biogenesis protein FliO